MGHHLGTRWRGRLPIPAHVHPLVRQLFTEMNEQLVTITEVAKRSGHRRGTISDWRYCRTPSVADLEAALNVLNLELTIRKKLP